MNKKFSVYALSDATGDLAHSLAVAAVNQFPEHDCRIIRISKITGTESLEEYVLKAKESHGVILFTFVSVEMRHRILDLCKIHEVVSVDILGSTLNSLANYLHALPSLEPGLQYKLTQNYFKRTEAVEFSVKHDDGLGLSTITQADILIFGISRTSKTPLSVYLAYQGYRCANIPVVKGIAIPEAVLNMDKSKMIALTIDPAKLASIRSARLQKLGRHDNESYAKMEHIKDEIAYAIQLYRSMKIPVIDVTNKAIEETASEVLNHLKI